MLMLMLAASTTPRLANADESSVARAQTLFDEGKTLFDADDFSAACPKLAESKELAPGIGVTLYLANCEETVGKRASALSHYREAETMAHARSDARESVARECALRLENETARIHIHLAPGSQKLTVTDNGRPVSINSNRGFPADPGSHKIRASSSGTGEWSEVVHVPDSNEGVDGMTIELSVPPLRDGATFSDHSTIDDRAGEPTTTSSPSMQKAIAIGVGGVGIVGLGVGTFLGLHAKSLQDESNGPGGGCNANDTCDPHGQDLRMSALSSAAASSIFFIVGGAAVVTGVVLYATAPSSRRDVAIAVGPGNAVLTGKF
jgi:serine/threonine-protein kinase